MNPTEQRPPPIVLPRQEGMTKKQLAKLGSNNHRGAEKTGTERGMVLGNHPYPMRTFSEAQVEAVQKVITQIVHNVQTFNEFFRLNPCPIAIKVKAGSSRELWICNEKLKNFSHEKVDYTSQDLPKRISQMCVFPRHRIVPKTKKELKAKWRELHKYIIAPSIEDLAILVGSLNPEERAFYKTTQEGIKRAFFPSVKKPFQSLKLTCALKTLPKMENIPFKNLNGEIFTSKFPVVIKAVLDVSRDYAKWIYREFPKDLNKEIWTEEMVENIPISKYF